MAAYCTQTLAGLSRDCSSNIGGLKGIWIGNFVDDAFTSASGAVTGVNSAVTFYHYVVKKNSSQATSTLNVNENGGNYVSTEIQLTFHRQDSLKRMEVAAMALGDMILVTEDANGVFTAYGVEQPVTANAGEATSGQNMDDANAYSITLYDVQGSWPMHLTEDGITAFKAKVQEPSSI